MKLYRLVSGTDDAAFCARVERLLNAGWELHGAPSVAATGERTIAAQAIVREVAGEYHGFVHLDVLHPMGAAE